ncbi:MAG: anhydro-N-acetylmuramic acid kinase [Bacteroidia bacterium]
MVQHTYNVIGLMSGTSLDGLDIAYCRFVKNEDTWEYIIIAAQTIHYPPLLKKNLITASTMSGLELTMLDAELGRYFGNQVKKFVKKNNLKKPDFIASHGHTIFHQPHKGYTLQIASGAHIAAKAGIPVVCDFRTLDIAMGGQGAPLVPVGDELLFNQFEYCLNLGGFANVSYRKNKKRIAFDICPVNIILNEIASRLGKAYDRNGLIAKKGKVNELLLKQLNKLNFYRKKAPKSLGKEWSDKYVLPLLNQSKLSEENLMATFVEHIAYQIAIALKVKKEEKILITGGGAYNAYLIERIAYYTKAKIILPDNKIIEFKEALIFAFLGLLRWAGKANTLKSVTGAKKDVCSGVIYLP